VCNTTATSAGAKTAYMQQYRGISAKLRSSTNQSTPNPPRQFILDLQAWLEHLIVEGHQLIVSMDSNEDVLSSPGLFTPLTYNPDTITSCAQHDGRLATLLKTCGLLDILTVHHTEDPPPTYNRGRKRLDYIFISNTLTPAVLRSGILPFYSLFLSDHRPCYIDIDATALFGEATSQITSADRRGLQLTDPRKVQKYKDNKKDQIKYHRIMEKLRDLRHKAQTGEWSLEDYYTYEKIDKLTLK
jgi:hypothetical protein